MLRYFFFALLLGLLSGSSRLSADVSIDGERVVPEYSLIRLTARGLPEGAAILWDDLTGGLDVFESGPSLIATGRPGRYQIGLTVIHLDDGNIKVQRFRTWVTIGKAPPPTPPPSPPGKLDPMNARVQIRFGNAGCTATVIGPRRKDGRWDVLTAAHCVSGVGQKGTGRMPDGTNLVLTVTARETSSDIAWLVTDGPGQDLYYAVLAVKAPAAGTPIWNAGYGVRNPGRKEVGQVDSEGCDSLGQLWYTIEMSGGDSGSGQFRVDNGECVATLFGTKGGRGVGGCCERAARLRPSDSHIATVLRYSLDGWVLYADGWHRGPIVLLPVTAQTWVPCPLGRE